MEEAGPAGGTDLAAAGRASTRWGLEDDTAAGTAGAGGQPYQGAALGVEEEGGWGSSGSSRSDGDQAAYGRNDVGQEGPRGVAHLLTGDDSERARVTWTGAAKRRGDAALQCNSTIILTCEGGGGYWPFAGCCEAGGCQ